MEKYIVGLGEVLFDLLPQGKKIGGAPANFAYHVSQFDMPGMVVSAVGDDEFGAEIVETLNARGLNQEMAVVDYPTGTVKVELDAAGIPQYEITENVAWDHIPFTPTLEEIARNTRAVSFGSLAQRSKESRDTINRFIDMMPDSEDTLKVFDINLRQHFYTKEIIDESITKCNILKINDEELVIVSRMFGYSDVDMLATSRMLLEKYNLRYLILTCGVNGSYVFSADGMSFLETPKVEVADTVGAGDSFTAAFITSILKDGSVKEAHKMAVETSAYVCTQEGAMPVLPSTFFN